MRIKLILDMKINEKNFRSEKMMKGPNYKI